MPSKLALFSAVTTHSGPWILADGTEKSIQVIGDGCDVEFECVESRETYSLNLGTTSTHPFPSGISRYRAILRVPGTMPTTVKVHFD